MPLERHRSWLRSIALVCSALLVPGDVLPMLAQDAAAQAPAPEAAKFSPDQLDSLVAPIALYPDDLLAQVLAGSTYPLEVVQLQQWLDKNKKLKDKALADAVAKQPWDPSVQGLAGLPDVVKKMAGDIKYTTDLGNAFLAQQADVMDAVQRMRKKAQDKGALKTDQQVKVETQVVESKQVVVIQQSNPQVVYVPSYDPVVVYGAPPPAYPYPPPGYYAAGMAISFGVGVAMGAMWSGGWGYHCGWGGGGNTVNINTNNNFNKVNNVRGGNNVGNGNSWQHNPSHRGAAPYGDRATANKFGGSTAGGNRGGVGGNRGGVGDNRGGVGGNRGGVGDNRGGIGDNRGGAGGNRGGVGDNRGGVGDNRGGAGAGGANRGGGGGDRVGNRSVGGGGGGGSSAFGGGGGGMSGSSARANSSRGSSSFGGGGGGGGRSRGGGGGGGGRRR